MSILAYCRVSKNDKTQDLERQFSDLERFSKEKYGEGLDGELYIFYDECSGRKQMKNRPGFVQMMTQLKAGDVIIAHEVSRIGRKTSEAIALADKLREQHIYIDTLKGVSSKDKLMWNVFCSMAEAESDYISYRTKSGLAIAKQNGVKLGTPTKDEEVRRVKFLVNRHKYPIAKACKQVGISKGCYYGHLNNHNRSGSPSKANKVGETPVSFLSFIM